MNDNDIKIMTHDNRIITLKELYKEHEMSHRAQAKLSYEEKVRILVELQKIARDWGDKKDVIVWDI